jgi:hypothetical protein
MNNQNQQTRSIKTIAKEIFEDWKNPYFGAMPYLNAMLDLNFVTDRYGMDSAKGIIL